MGPAEVVAVAPGRVNLIGDHTDTTGGLVLPMAIDMATTVTGAPGGDRVVLTSDVETEPAVIPLTGFDPAELRPAWARYVGGVVAELVPSIWFEGHVTTTLPVGAGLSSSAALEVAVTLALGFSGSELDLARLCQRAEQRASGVPCGIMDQLTSVAGRTGHGLLIDCRSLVIEEVPIPKACEIRVIHSGQQRSLATSAYGERRAALEAAEAVLGPLRDLRVIDLTTAGQGLSDEVLLRRVRHVVTENDRVRRFADALRVGDLVTAGRLMSDSHRSLRDDFGVSTPALDEIVRRLESTDGVHGARLTGAGFGGCVVALTEPHVISEGWSVRAADGAHRLTA